MSPAGRAALLLLALLPALAAVAHEVRPAYLSIEETEPGVHRVTWKQPVLGEYRLALDPVLPEHCEVLSEGLPENTGAALISRWDVRCDLSHGVIFIQGLSRTLTDVMVRITRLDGEQQTYMLKPDAPTLDLQDPVPPIAAYLTLGVEHLIFGIDHILFVIGLVLFIPDRWMLLKTITAFTVAHSLTLALSVLELVRLPQGPVEAVIALSILFLARELMLPEEKRSALMRVRPWLMAFTFGLLHGFGFAGALADIGLPEGDLALALFLFNVGIEIGQLMVIAVMIAITWISHRLHTLESSVWQRAFTVLMGVAAAYWTIDRTWLVL
ncbi:MAG: HupE/UreJ family protein [Pseudomonadales bacterium]